jgi:hypothetical protein
MSGNDIPIERVIEEAINNVELNKSKTETNAKKHAANALSYYHKNKDRINAANKERRQRENTLIMNYRTRLNQA